LLRAWRYSCDKLSTKTSERQFTIYTTRPPNYTLHPTPGVGLGADFLRKLARRG
jgi:hypothetical protein